MSRMYLEGNVAFGIPRERFKLIIRIRDSLLGELKEEHGKAAADMTNIFLTDSRPSIALAETDTKLVGKLQRIRKNLKKVWKGIHSPILTDCMLFYIQNTLQN